MLSALRLHMADALNVPREGHQLLWVVNFPMFKYDEDEKKYAGEHPPFTHVLDEDVDKIESDPLACGSYSYDLVMDGFEAVSYTHLGQVPTMGPENACHH